MPFIIITFSFFYFIFFAQGIQAEECSERCLSTKWENTCNCFSKLYGARDRLNGSLREYLSHCTFQFYFLRYISHPGLAFCTTLKLFRSITQSRNHFHSHRSGTYTHVYSARSVQTLREYNGGLRASYKCHRLIHQIQIENSNIEILQGLFPTCYQISIKFCIVFYNIRQ